MKIEKVLTDYYKAEAESVAIPPCPVTGPVKAAGGNDRKMVPLRIAIVAVIAVAFIPMARGATGQSALAVRAASVCRTYELDTRIPEGLLDLNKIASKSFFTEERK